MAFYFFKSGIIWLAKISSSKATWNDYMSKRTSWPSMEKMLNNWAMKVRGTCLSLRNYFYTKIYIKHIPECCQDNSIAITWISLTSKPKGNESTLHSKRPVGDVIPVHIYIRLCSFASKILKHMLNFMGWPVYSFQWCKGWLRPSRWLRILLYGGLDAGQEFYASR